MIKSFAKFIANITSKAEFVQAVNSTCNFISGITSKSIFPVDMTPVSNWILTTFFWDDSGVYDDFNVWND